MGLINETPEQYYEGDDNLWNSGDENYGKYQFISAKDMINNFIISYVGEDKIISKVKRTDVAFHVLRTIQELSYDTLPSTKALEFSVPPSLSFPLPQDYINYVKFTYVDASGIERVLYPAVKTSNPKALLQDNNGEILFDIDGNIIEANESTTLSRYNSNPQPVDDKNVAWEDYITEWDFGRRYGGTPEYMQSNGTFLIDQPNGLMRFSANLSDAIVTVKYISDGLAYDEDTVVHKFAEEAVYKAVALAILSARANTPEYIINRFKREKAAARRNAKIRLSNIKIEEIAQVMRNKSKHLKH